MASSITHELIAREAQDLLPEEVRAQTDAAPDYYFLGAQGPDLFFFYRPLRKKEYNLGKTLHRGKLYLWFNALADALKTRTGEAYEKCLAYALGFCSHLSADVAFHPYVYAYLEKHGATKRTHQQMENDWDVYFLRKLRGKTVYGYDFPFNLKKIAREGILYAYVRDAARALNRTVKKGAFRRMLSLFGWYLAHFHKRHGRFLRPFGLSRMYPSKTPLEGVLGGEEFSALTGGKETCDELFDGAVSESAARILEFSAAARGEAPLPEETFGRHLLTGQPTQ